MSKYDLRDQYGRTIGTVVPANNGTEIILFLFIIAAVVIAVACMSPFAVIGGTIYFLYALSLPEGTPGKGGKIAVALLIVIISSVIACLSGGVLLFQYLESLQYPTY